MKLKNVSLVKVHLIAFSKGFSNFHDRREIPL